MSESKMIIVMASAAITQAYHELVPQFERTSGHRVTTHWIPTVDMMNRVKNGERVDLVFLTAAMIDELIDHGRLATGSRVDLVRSSVGVAVRAGAPRPDLANGEALKGALLAARSIAYSTGPSGVYIAELIGRLGITEPLRAKTKIVKGEPVGALIARGDAEIGFQQVSELLPVRGIDLLGPLPADVAKVTVFSMGCHVDCPHVDAARALVDYLRSPQSAPVMKEHGLDPL